MATISVACCLLFLFRLVESTVIPLTTVDFEERIIGSPSFVMFYGPWCEHCKSLMPTWEDLSSEYKKKNKQINIAKVDCVAETPICAKHNVKAYPSLRLYHQGGVKRYYGKRSIPDFTKFVNEFVFKESSEKVESSEPLSENDVRILTANNFDDETATGLHFVKFYAPWCIHCIRLAPIWDKLASKYKDSAHVTISKIDCTTHKTKCNAFDVNAFPTLKLFQDGKEIDQYTGNRVLRDLESYVAIKISEYNPPPPTKPPTTTPVEENDDDVDDLIKPYQLNQHNFEATVSFGTTFVKFYAPWCVHCRKLAPIWDQLAKKCAETAGGPKIAKIDCTAEEQLCQNLGVNGYPTLTLFKDGNPKQEYTGNRDLESLYKFVIANHDKDEL